MVLINKKVGSWQLAVGSRQRTINSRPARTERPPDRTGRVRLGGQSAVDKTEYLQ